MRHEHKETKDADPSMQSLGLSFVAFFNPSNSQSHKLFKHKILFSMLPTPMPKVEEDPSGKGRRD